MFITIDSIRIVEDIEVVSLSGRRNINDLTRLDEWELDIPETVSGHGIGFVRKILMDDDLN